MAKGSRGGKRNGASGSTTIPKMQIQPTQVTPPSPKDVANGNVLPKGGVPFDQFEKMTDDEKADVVLKALGVGLPMFLDDSDVQKLAYYTGLSEKPQVVSDSALDNVKGTEIFRTVNDAYDGKTDIGYSANDIYKQVAYGDFTMYSGSARSAYGRAIYFANNTHDSAVYGRSGKNPTMMRAKLTGKTITTTQLSNDYNNARRRGDKLALACSKADSASAQHLYALSKGYDAVVDNGWGSYIMVLNRRGITLSDKTKNAMPNGTYRRSWN